MEKKLLSRVILIGLLLIIIFNESLYSQTVVTLEAEAGTWTETFDDYLNSSPNWTNKTSGSQPGRGLSGSSTNIRGRKIALSDIPGFGTGTYDISVSYYDGDGSTNNSQFWLQIGDRTCEVTNQTTVCSGTGFVADVNWPANQNTNGIYTYSNANSAALDNVTITVSSSDSLYLFMLAGNSSNIFDKVVFTSTNLNNPVVTASQVFSTSECSSVGTVVGNVAATDADGDEFTYTILSGAAGKFTINSNTGVISVADVLDFETVPSYTLSVQVTDNGWTNRLSAAANVTINLSNCSNDFVPVVNPLSFNVNENSANGTLVGTVSASDADGGQTLTYSIVSGNTGNVFTINAATGQIRVNGAINYETLSSYSLTIRATDNGTPSRNSTGVYTIAINDVNENPNAPAIANQARSVAENSPIGTLVGTVVTASDADGHSLAYSITAGNAAGKFLINSVTGQITVAGTLDFEGVNSYPLTVQVTDNGVPARSSSATVTIGVTNVADNNINAPVIVNQTFSVDENSTSGMPVGTVVASDPDWYQTLTYSITAGNAAGKFAINAATGVITVVGTLDYETPPTSYALTVRATDNGSPSTLFTAATITININNIDESGVFPFILRNTWDGPYDVRMIAAPSQEAVYVNQTQAGLDNILADSVITLSTMVMNGNKIDINNRFAGAPKSISLSLQSVLCDSESPCTLGLTQVAATASCPVKYSGTANTVSPWVSLTYADYDDDLTTYSSSMAELDISDCSEIEAAHLYWTGTFRGSGDALTLLDGPLNSYSGSGDVFNVGSGFTSTFNTVKFKTPGGTYQTVAASAGNTRVIVGDNTRYLAVADVTSMVQGSGGGQFWVGNVQSYPSDAGGGSASGWVLVVVFRSPLSPPRRIMLWDGLEMIPQNGTKTFTLTGLAAPATTNFESYVGFAALDGENINSEGVSMANAEGLGFQTNASGPAVTINPFATDQPRYKLWNSGYPAQNNGTTQNKTSGCNVPLFDGNWGSAYDGISSMRITSYEEANGLNGNEITRLPSNPRTLGLDAHHMKLPTGSVASAATQATLTVKAGPQGSTLPFLAYIAIELLQPKLEITKTADKNSTTTNSQITYTLTIKNNGNAVSTLGDKVFDTLDIATDYNSFTSTKFVNGVPSAGGVTLTSSVGDNLEFSLPAIQKNDSVRIFLTVDVKPIAGNAAIWVTLCKRTILNTAYVEYSTLTSGTFQAMSNSSDCTIGEETRVLIIDGALSASASTIIGPVDATTFMTDPILDNVQDLLINPGGVLTSELDQYDIRDASNVRIQPSDIFSGIGNQSYFAYRDYTGSGNCQEIFEIIFDVPLPVELLSFIGQKSDEGVQLKWVTSSEKDNHYFIIERSINGIDFISIGMVQGNGSSENAHVYNFYDEQPLNGINYYRLRQVDFNGQYSYSKTIVVQSKPSAALEIYPNPNNGIFTINLLTIEQPYRLDIVDVNGRIVYSMSGENVPGSIEFSNIAKGVYIVRLYLEDQLVVKKMIVY